ncbi:MAG: DUF4129 domain-containing protein [Acidimicrobiia bacterium]|nr:DUF4129 domain-containing protein [Acidimicrobiia bacterium]
MTFLGGLSATSVDPAVAREDARRILEDRRFRSEPVPRPFRGPLEWLGDRLQSLARFVADLLRPVPGPTWVALAVVAVVVAVLLLVRLTSRPGAVRLRGGSAERRIDAESEDPEALEAAAADAERRGDLSAALRLRFRAGLLRLDERGAITFRPSLTTGEVRRLLGSETFEEIAAVFEEVAYGGRDAVPEEVAGARDSWPRIVREARSR